MRFLVCSSRVQSFHSSEETDVDEISRLEAAKKSFTFASTLQRIMTKCFADAEDKAEDYPNDAVLMKSSGATPDVKRRVQKWLDENCDPRKLSDDQQLPSRMLHDYVQSWDKKARANELDRRTTSWITIQRYPLNR